MKIRKIKFENYRCFLNGEIDFNVDNKKNMTILVAKNGGGKTETLFAFWWVLYGVDFSQFENKEATPYALNSDLYRELERAQMGSTKTCSVELTFEDEDKTYIVTKWAEYKKNIKDQIKVTEYQTLAELLDNGETTVPIRDMDKIQIKLNRIIPKTILHGIIFDGERMKKLSSPNENATNAIRGVVFDITNRELLEKCIIHLESVKKSLNNSLRYQDKKSGGKGLQTLLFELDRDEREYKRLLGSYATDSEELDNKKLKLKDISLELEKNAEAKRIEGQRKVARESLITHEKILSSYYKNFSAVLKDAYLISATHLLDTVDTIIQKYDVPQELTVPAVRNILTRRKCICGKDMDEDAVRMLNQLILSLPPDNINSTLAEVVRQTRTRVLDIKAQAKDYYDLIQEEETKIIEIKEQISSYSTLIASLEGNGEEVERAKRLEEENKMLYKRIGVLEASQKETERRIAILEDNIKTNKGLRDLKTRNAEEAKKVNAQILFIEKCIDAFESLKEKNRQKALREINSKLNDAYMDLCEDADRGRRLIVVQYDERKQYTLAVFMKSEVDALICEWKRSGEYERLHKLGKSEEEIYEKAILESEDGNSTGQSKINTFSFVKAILDYSNSQKDDAFEIKKNYPLIIDAPFGDISEGNLERSSNKLHSFSDQVILMIDRDRYTPLRKAFDEYTWRKYTFKKAGNANYSTIEIMEE